METNYIILSFIMIPIFGFLLSLVIPQKKELALSRVAIYTTVLQFIVVVSFIVFWIIKGAPLINIKEVVLFKSKEYEFFIDFFFDKITAVYLFTGSFVTLLIARYSRYYMHLEDGYKRFFNTILFFYVGYNWTVISGNFETLFIGWEILGISSFLLIAFYRNRYLPVKNAIKVFSVYRIGDMGILAAMWASHHLWHENITFLKLSNYDLVHEHLVGHSETGILIGLALLTAAAAKSAQIPYSSWLPRAMEGPTPSSAIFYGSLSVHFGVFLLLRTFPFWEGQLAIRILIGLTGLLTAIVCYFITRVQSTIKTQIAYSSITQIGIMFIEVALGLHTLALVHFAGNAFLRTYQLLVSPSVVSYLIRDQFYHFVPTEKQYNNGFYGKIKNTIYLLSLKEWYMDYFMSNVVFKSLKKVGQYLDFLTPKNVLYYFVPLYLIGLLFYYNSSLIPTPLLHNLPEIISFLGLIMALKSFSERRYAKLSWLLIVFSHFCIALSVSYNEHFDFSENLFYLIGISVSGIIGFICIHVLRKKEPQHSDLNEYYGHVEKYPVMSFVFFLATLGLMGFPITPSFIGEDLIFSHINDHQYVLGFFVALTFVVGGISLVRNYARLFLGPYCKPNKSNPIKSS
jgi:NADH-quinone oxidoreductase subunit L